MKNSRGVWLDSSRALVIEDISGEPIISRLVSEAEKKTHATGGHHRSQGYGHDSVVGHLQADHRRRHALETFFGEIADRVADSDALYVVGPGLTKKHFLNFLSRHDNGRQPEVVMRTCASHLTENQITALMKELDRENLH